ncbi:MAG: CIA30 family protein [Phycisphaerales bacterium JB040]
MPTLPLMLASLVLLGWFPGGPDHAENPTTPLEPRTVLDFDSADAAERWVVVNDNVMGGRSEGGPEFTGQTVLFTGTTNTNGGGFSSIQTVEQAWDTLADADGLLVRVRGDGREYIARLRTDARVMGRRVAYHQTFQTSPDGSWAVVRIPFDKFRATVFGEDVSRWAAEFDPARVRTLGFMIYDKQDGPFRLEIDWVKAYTGEALPPDHDETL